MLLLAVLLGLAIAFLGWAVRLFNGLVRARNLVRNGSADIDVQLQRRHDLVPQLVEAVRAYAGYEEAVLAEVTELRSRAERADGIEERNEAEGALAGGIDRLVLLAEAYPDLKAADNFRQLMGDLVEVEDHLQHARRFYNGAARDLNTRIERFPDLLVARTTGFHPAPFFDAGIEASEAPRVDRLLERS